MESGRTGCQDCPMPIATTDATDATAKYRLPGLIVAILVIVIVPFALNSIASRASLNAQEALLHTHEVEAGIATIAADVRNIESAALAQAFGVDAQLLHERINYSRPRIVPKL